VLGAALFALRQQRRAAATLALPVPADAAWQPRADAGQPQGTAGNWSAPGDMEMTEMDNGQVRAGAGSDMSVSLLGGAEVRRSALPGGVSKRVAMGGGAAAALLLGPGPLGVVNALSA
jgi:hypothetical protein